MSELFSGRDEHFAPYDDDAHIFMCVHGRDKGYHNDYGKICRVLIKSQNLQFNLSVRTVQVLRVQKFQYAEY